MGSKKYDPWNRIADFYRSAPAAPEDEPKIFMDIPQPPEAPPSPPPGFILGLTAGVCIGLIVGFCITAATFLMILY